jgi:c-di-GMP-binding flagellar brake protein YcgR
MLRDSITNRRSINVSERRQYYRIDHPVIIEHKCVSDEDVAHSNQPFQFEVSAYFSLQAQLHAIDAECSHYLHRISESSAPLSAYLQSLNRKIELIAQALTADSLKLDQGEPQFINLSEGGINFLSQQSLEPGQALALKLVFTESRLGMMLYARVIRSEAQAEDFEVAAEFLHMPENCRTQLARLILEAQARQRQNELYQE